MLKRTLDTAGHPVLLLIMIVIGIYFLISPETRGGKIFPDLDKEDIIPVNSMAYADGVQQIQYQMDEPQNFQYIGNVPPSYPAAIPDVPAVQDVMLQEGHWIGLETITLTPELAAANNIPENVEGVLVDEVTLLSARSGVLAGDVIVGINGNRVRDLAEFQVATKMVKDMRYTNITVFRKGDYLDIPVEAPDSLGFAQMEAAPTILPGATSPHKYYGQCDQCHVIAPKDSNVNTAHLGKDMGDTLALSPPPININSALPHRYRGVCQNCHEILVN